MEVLTKKEQDNLVIHLIGELDEHAAPYVRTAMDDSLASNTFSGVIFDLERMSFMDSTGIGVLIGRYKKLKGKHATYVRNVSRTVDKIFTMSGLYSIMPKL